MILLLAGVVIGVLLLRVWQVDEQTQKQISYAAAVLDTTSFPVMITFWLAGVQQAQVPNHSINNRR